MRTIAQFLILGPFVTGAVAFGDGYDPNPSNNASFTTPTFAGGLRSGTPLALSPSQTLTTGALQAKYGTSRDGGSLPR